MPTVLPFSCMTAGRLLRTPSLRSSQPRRRTLHSWTTWRPGKVVLCLFQNGIIPLPPNIEDPPPETFFYIVYNDVQIFGTINFGSVNNIYGGWDSKPWHATPSSHRAAERRARQEKRRSAVHLWDICVKMDPITMIFPTIYMITTKSVPIPAMVVSITNPNNPGFQSIGMGCQIHHWQMMIH